MSLIECNIRTLAKEIFNRKVVSVTLESLHEGRIGIGYGHEDMEFFLGIGVLEIHMKESIRRFYNGAGLVQIKNNAVNIVAFPMISTSEKLEDNKFDLYSKECYKIWKTKEAYLK